MLSDKMTSCLNLARTRGIFALARIGCRRQPSRWEDLYGQASNRARRWNLKLGAKAEGLRGLHTSASLFGTNVLLKLHYSQCIPSLDATVLHKLLTNITICTDLSYYQWTLYAPLAVSNTTIPPSFCVTAATSSNPTFSIAGKSHTAIVPQEVSELDIVTDTILVEMHHNIDPADNSDEADSVAKMVGQIVKRSLCEEQSNIYVYVLKYYSTSEMIQ